MRSLINTAISEIRELVIMFSLLMLVLILVAFGTAALALVV
jgi:hypothetical protein